MTITLTRIGISVFAMSFLGDWNLLPGRIGLAPIAGGPTLIEIFQGSKAFLQVGLEVGKAGGAVADGAVFVIELPTNDIGTAAKACCHCLDNPTDVTVILGRIGAVMAAPVACCKRLDPYAGKGFKKQRS